MLNSTLLDNLNTTASNLPGPLLSKTLFFHDVQITCQTNHPAILAILDAMLGMYSEPARIRGEAFYSIFCYNNFSQFPIQIPSDRRPIEAVRLVTNTKLKYYHSPDHTTQYHSYAALPTVNAPALTVINSDDHIALTQLEMPEQYQVKFLHRYVLLIALGQLTRNLDFEPCHAAAITAPWDNQQCALIIGTSRSGKTTLSLSCTLAGSGLLGDDLIMLGNDTPLINAFTIMHEVSIRTDSLDLLQSLSFLKAFPADDRDKHYCAIEEIRTGATCFKAPIRLLIFPSLSTETESLLTPLSKADTLQMLIDECFSKKYLYPQAQEQFFSLLYRLSEQAKGYKLTIALGATDGPRIVQSLFSGSP